MKLATLFVLVLSYISLSEPACNQRSQQPATDPGKPKVVQVFEGGSALAYTTIALLLCGTVIVLKKRGTRGK